MRQLRYSPKHEKSLDLVLFLNGIPIFTAELKNPLNAQDVGGAIRQYMTQVVRNGLGDRAGTCIDPKTQIVQGKTVCLVSCQRSPEPVFLKWKEMEAEASGDFFVRSGPGAVRLPPESAAKYIRTRFPGMTSPSR